MTTYSYTCLKSRPPKKSTKKVGSLVSPSHLVQRDLINGLCLSLFFTIRFFGLTRAKKISSRSPSWKMCVDFGVRNTLGALFN